MDGAYSEKTRSGDDAPPARAAQKARKRFLTPFPIPDDDHVRLFFFEQPLEVAGTGGRGLEPDGGCCLALVRAGHALELAQVDAENLHSCVLPSTKGLERECFPPSILLLA